MGFISSGQARPRILFMGIDDLFAQLFQQLVAWTADVLQEYQRFITAYSMTMYHRAKRVTDNAGNRGGTSQLSFTRSRDRDASISAPTWLGVIGYCASKDCLTYAKDI